MRPQLIYLKIKTLSLLGAITSSFFFFFFALKRIIKIPFLKMRPHFISLKIMILSPFTRNFFSTFVNFILLLDSYHLLQLFSIYILNIITFFFNLLNKKKIELLNTFVTELACEEPSVLICSYMSIFFLLLNFLYECFKKLR